MKDEGNHGKKKERQGRSTVKRKEVGKKTK